MCPLWDHVRWRWVGCDNFLRGVIRGVKVRMKTKEWGVCDTKWYCGER